MTKVITHTIRKAIKALLATACVGAVALGGSASAKEYNVIYSTASAPIAYKLASPTMMPQYVQPQHQTFGTPQITGVASTFDQSRIDKTLRANQHIGNPYTVYGQTYYPEHEPNYDMVGTASWYGDKFHGKLTANGETFNKNALTAAHKTLPLNSLVVVTNMVTGQSVTLRINDRGPFIGNRLIDLSEAAANALGYKIAGLGEVRVQYAGPALPTQQTMTAPAQRKAPQAYSATPAVPQAGLPQSSVPIPQAYAQNDLGTLDQFETLTIKGPVHMARSKNSQAKLIKAVNRITYKTK